MLLTFGINCQLIKAWRCQYVNIWASTLMYNACQKHSFQIWTPGTKHKFHGPHRSQFHFFKLNIPWCLVSFLKLLSTFHSQRFRSEAPANAGCCVRIHLPRDTHLPPKGREIYMPINHARWTWWLGANPRTWSSQASSVARQLCVELSGTNHYLHFYSPWLLLRLR